MAGYMYTSGGLQARLETRLHYVYTLTQQYVTKGAYLHIDKMDKRRHFKARGYGPGALHCMVRTSRSPVP